MRKDLTNLQVGDILTSKTNNHSIETRIMILAVIIRRKEHTVYFVSRESTYGKYDMGEGKTYTGFPESSYRLGGGLKTALDLNTSGYDLLS